MHALRSLSHDVARRSTTGVSAIESLRHQPTTRRRFRIAYLEFASQLLSGLFSPLLRAGFCINGATKLLRYRGADTHGPNLCRYSRELMKALTISAFRKSPLNWFSFVSQKS